MRRTALKKIYWGYTDDSNVVGTIEIAEFKRNKRSDPVLEFPFEATMEIADIEVKAGISRRNTTRKECETLLEAIMHVQVFLNGPWPASSPHIREINKEEFDRRFKKGIRTLEFWKYGKS
jgi:hypothetical protein